MVKVGWFPNMPIMLNLRGLLLNGPIIEAMVEMRCMAMHNMRCTHHMRCMRHMGCMRHVGCYWVLVCFDRGLQSRGLEC